MCKQHWERIMDMILERRVPEFVNLVEVRAYIYACYLENHISQQEWNQFEAAAMNIDSAILLIGYSHDHIDMPEAVSIKG